ncbi:MAG: chromate transporter [Bacillota bacterium]
MIYFILFWTFFRIGLFSFGGGYAMIPLMGKEMEAYGWIGAKEFADIIAVSQMTPGPIAVNAATYVGVKTAGILGSASATLGVTLPSFIILIIISHFFIQFKENKIIESILKGIRPVTIGMVCSAVIFMAETSIFRTENNFEKLRDFFIGKITDLSGVVQIDFVSVFIFFIILLASAKFKLHPIWAVVTSAFLGIFSYIVLNLPLI